MSQLMGPDQIADAVEDLAKQIHESTGEGPLHIIGIRSRGDEVAERVCNEIAALSEREVLLGTLDISLYRDDFAHLHGNPTLQGSDIPFEVDGVHLVLVDDVLFTGRTIRAALDAISDYGRPARVELGVLVDRGWRELPIEPKYVGKLVETQREDHIIVKLDKTDGEDAVEVIQNS